MLISNIGPALGQCLVFTDNTRRFNFGNSICWFTIGVLMLSNTNQ